MHPLSMKIAEQIAEQISLPYKPSGILTWLPNAIEDDLIGSLSDAEKQQIKQEVLKLLSLKAFW